MSAGNLIIVKGQKNEHTNTPEVVSQDNDIHFMDRILNFYNVLTFFY